MKMHYRHMEIDESNQVIYFKCNIIYLKKKQKQNRRAEKCL